ncbi:MAG: phosphate ABC transporter permease subunit PstC [Alphaproteobacteria bacterium]|nr:phosphate ABC transporter permease subunit PstC [Alphaproteobacteria bacterium]
MDDAAAGAPTASMNKVSRRFARIDAFFRNLTGFAAFGVLAVLAGVIVSLYFGAQLSIDKFGLAFLWTDVWNPVKQEFGALSEIYGTLLTSALAMLLAIPVGIGIAIFLTELSPLIIKRPIGIAIELLAGIPSIIYGIWGLFVLAPFLQVNVQPWIIDTFADVPILSSLFAGPPFGVGYGTAGFILAMMVLPFIAAITRDVFDGVPSVLKEAAYGLGCTRWEVLWHVVLPYARVGVTGGIMLALGRALGETMAVTFVIGNNHRISSSLFAPGTTISAAIANEFTEATSDMYLSALIEIGLILFGITFIVLLIARYMLYRMELRTGR